MNALLNDWAEGRFNIEKPTLILSENEISVELHEGCEYSGSLKIASECDYMIKGHLFCDSPCVRFTQNSFEGKEIVLDYKIITKGLYEGDIIRGNLRIYSNLDIADLPILIRILAPNITIGNITISDLDEFAVLLSENYTLATEFFFHSQFERIILKDNNYAKAAGRMIKAMKYKEEAVDRFSYAMGLKDRTVLSFSDLSFSKIFAPKQLTKYSFELTRENSSNINISVVCDENFIVLSKDVIEQKDFVGNKFIFHYQVDPALLAQGLNEAVIYFKNDIQEIKYKILIDNASLSEIEKKRLIKKRKYVLTLMNSYIDFRLNKISKEEWAKNSLNDIQSLERLSDDMFVRLYQVHLLLALNEFDKSKSLLYSINIDNEADVTNKAYFLYLVAFFTEDLEFTDKLTGDLKKYRQDRPELFSLLWFLLFLDDEYVDNISKRYKALKEQYSLSGGDVILLCEAAILLNKSPELLSEFTEFEIEVCNFAFKHNYISGTLWNAVFHIAGFDRSFKKGVFRLLCAGYDKYMTFDRLADLSSYCITGGCINERFLFIYEQSIMQGSSINEIYEYYLKSLPFNYDKPILKQALHYFKYKSDMADEDRALLYANVLKFYHNDEIYNEYANSIKSFTLDMLAKKHVDENTVFLYNAVLSVDDITAVNVNEMAFISFLVLVKVKYFDATEIVVADGRLTEQLNVKLINKMAVVPMCFDDLCIGFLDSFGKLHIDKNYIELEPLIHRPDLLQACKNYKSECFEYQLYTNDIRNLLLVNNLSDEFRFYCNNEAAKYYTENPYDDLASDFIEKVDDCLLNLEAKYQVANLNIVYNKINTAIRLMTTYGYYGMDMEELTDLCEILIKVEDADSIRALVDDSWLVNLSAYLYNSGVRSNKIITLLTLSWDGNLYELLKLWESCAVLEINKKPLEERILTLSCYLRIVDMQVLNIYDSYTKGQINKRVAQAYLSLLAFDYYILKHKWKNRRKVFFHIVNYYMNFKKLSGICQLAALDYLADAKELTEDDKDFIIGVIKEHIASGLYFDIFEVFNELLSQRKIELSFKRQKHFVMHIDEPGRLILIKYRVLNKNGEPVSSMTESERGNMQEIFPCIYIKDFILFAGESVDYIVVGFENDREIELYEKNIKAGIRKVKQFNKDRYDMVEEMLMSKSKRDAESQLKKICLLDAMNKELFLLR